MPSTVLVIVAVPVMVLEVVSCWGWEVLLSASLSLNKVLFLADRAKGFRFVEIPLIVWDSVTLNAPGC
jgi:hypothetical protein